MENGQPFDNEGFQGKSPLTSPKEAGSPSPKGTDQGGTRNRETVAAPDDAGEEQPSDSSVNSDEYDFVEREVREDDNAIAPTPAYRFPGTWDGAYHHTAAALVEVGAATKSYGNAIAKSGITKAGWSIGGALAKTANQGALVAANYAVNATVTNQQLLPSRIKNWLKGKEKLDEAKRRAEDAEKARMARRLRMETGQPPGMDESAVPSGSQWQASGGGEPFVIGDDPEEEQAGISIKPSPKNPWITSQQNSPASLPFQTPAHAKSVFKNFETPGSVRRKLSEPLGINIPVQRPVSSASKENSPYSGAFHDGIGYMESAVRPRRYSLVGSVTSSSLLSRGGAGGDEVAVEDEEHEVDEDDEDCFGLAGLLE
ncbi:hypothetical protein BDV95DRAFT_606439 [Massariosphaeria phaeospora]|uniref:Uncharacterized protein n=1 Tax=Massariosphaeria phaeospora TaxID=100035 RepID=A0A7C8IFP8_9PLEO|nr:hypothetical protein BDV95DRAFT_606439 [Massariosphaeria phaeospora]